jgi:hypothetical protein
MTRQWALTPFREDARFEPKQAFGLHRFASVADIGGKRRAIHALNGYFGSKSGIKHATFVGPMAR